MTFKRMIAFLLAVAMLFAFASCKGNPQTNQPTQGVPPVQTGVNLETAPPAREYIAKVAAFGNDASTVPMVKFAADRSFGYAVSFEADAAAVEAKITGGQADIAVLPLESAAKLYEGGAKIKILTVCNYGYLQLLAKDKNISGRSSLSGKTVYAADCGTKSIIETLIGGSAGEIIYLENYQAVYDKAVAGQADICVLPEPYATELVVEDLGYRYAEVFNTAWFTEFEFDLAQTCIVATDSFLQAHADLAEEFLSFFEMTANFIDDVDTRSIVIGTLLHDAGLYSVPEAAVASVPYCGITSVTGEKMKTLVESNLKKLGRTAPNDEFYYIP